jgi:hypothetical protein
MLSIATQLRVPKDFKLPRDIARLVKDHRAEYVRSKVRPTEELSPSGVLPSEGNDRKKGGSLTNHAARRA